MTTLSMALGLIAAFTTLVAQDQTPKIRMHNNARAMKKEILKGIPIGSNIHTAKTIIEANDFQCEMKQHAAFSESTDDPTNPILHEGVDYLLCHKKKIISPLITRSWAIVILQKEGVIENIYV